MYIAQIDSTFACRPLNIMTVHFYPLPQAATINSSPILYAISSSTSSCIFIVGK